MTKKTLQSKILEGLNKEQERAVTHGPGPLLIVAGAGTGKTTVITRRIAYLIEQGTKSESILAMAFGEKAAAEMSERVDLLLPYGYFNLQISTFHSFCERILADYGVTIGLPDFKILDETGQWLMIRNNLDKFDLDYYRPLGNPTRFIRALVSHFGRCKDELVTPAEYLEYADKMRLDLDNTPSLQLPPAEVEEINRVREVANAYHVYERLLLQNQALDFGSLINYSLELFKKRPKILELFQKKFEYVLIDEFQDTNYAQYELIKLLTKPKNNLTVVGDDDQSVFKFRGASISNILHFKNDYKSAKFVSLTQNYRSRQKILDLAYKFIRQNDPDRLEVRLGIDKKLKATPHPTSPTGSEEFTEEIHYHAYADYLAEASGVVSQIIELKKQADLSTTWNDFAILARSHDTLEPFINKLEDDGIPYIYFANRGLYRKRIIVDLLAYLKLLDNYHESHSLYRVLNLPVFGLGHEAIVELSHYAKKKSVSLYEAVRLAGVGPDKRGQDLIGIKKFLTFLDKHSKLADEKSVGQVFVEIVSDLEFARLQQSDNQQGLQNAKYLEAFSRKIQNFQNENADKSLKSFMQGLNFELEAGGQGDLEFDPDAGPEAVKLMTVHGAKGLEFENVFVVGLVDKRFPSLERREQIETPLPLIKDILPEGDIHLEEERRLFYVAMTRAKQGLYLSRALDYGGKLTKKPSRFLIELGLAQAEISKPTGDANIHRLNVGESSPISFPIPKYFSFSQISLFKSCPQGYKFRYLLGLPTKGAPALSFGLTIHKTFENFIKLIRNQDMAVDLFGESASNRLPKFEILQELYQKFWIDEWYDSKSHMADYRKLGESILKIFYEEIKNNPPKPKYLEQSFRLRLENGYFVGKIDRADLTPGGLVIIDYKTGSPRGINKVDKDQLLIYQWAAQDFLKEKVADLQYWFLKDRLKKESFLGVDADIALLKKNLTQTASEIIEATKQNSFLALDERISHDCEYRDLE